MIKSFFRANRWDICVVLLFVLFSVAIWWPSHYYPMFWDSTFLVVTAKSILNSNFTDLISHHPGYAQPTLPGIVLAILWKFFGTSLTVSHLLTFPFLPILLISVYLFISKPTNRVLGFLSAALVGFTPVVLAEYVNVYVDLPAAAFAALSLVFWQRKKYSLWALIYAAAILSKLPAIAVAPYFILSAIKHDRKKIAMTILVPVIVVASWLIYHYTVTGWLLTSSDLQLAVDTSAFNPLADFVNIFKLIIFGQGRAFLSVITIGGLIYLFLTKKPSLNRLLQPSLYEDLLPIVTATVLFVAVGGFGHRYAMVIYIFYAAIVAKTAYYFIHTYQHTKNYIYLLFILALILVTNLWHPQETALTTTRFNAPDDLGIVDYIYVFRSVAAFAETHRYSDYVYYGAFPENVALTDPTFGFITAAVPFKSCEDFHYNPKEKQVIVIHPFSPTQYPCFQLRQSQAVTAIGGSEHNGKWVDLFLVNTPEATPSADSPT